MQKLIQVIGTCMFVAALLAGCATVMAGPQVEPAAGRWSTWVLESTDQVSVPAPPAQAAARQKLQEMKALAGELDDAARDQVAYWDAGSPSYRGIEIALDQFNTKPMPNPRL